MTANTPPGARDGAEVAAAAATPAGSYLRVVGVSKDFADCRALEQVDLEVGKGEIFALLGASGCGKSTLLRVLAGFETPSEGHVILDGEPLDALPPHRRPVNMMFQSYALFPHMSVEKNIAFGLKQEGLRRAEIAERVVEMLTLVRMGEYARRKPDQLSGGQQQRVALARSLIKRPKLLLLDEPMGALDRKLRAQMQIEVVDILRRLGVTCLMVTHDQDEAMTMAGRIAIMERGRIRQVGAPAEVYEKPSCRYSAEFIGSVNLFEGRVSEQFPDHLLITSRSLPYPIRVGYAALVPDAAQVTLAVRPEKMSLSHSPPAQAHNKLSGVIERIAYFGSHSAYYLRTPSGQTVRGVLLNAQRQSGPRFVAGEQAWMAWEADAVVVLPA